MMTILRRFAVPLALGASLSVMAAETKPGAAEAPASTTIVAAAPPPARVFISGHSLTNRPMPDFLEEIAASAGRAFYWNRQHVNGSSIKARSYGDDDASPWSGFSKGVDRRDGSIETLNELRNPSDGSGAPYDALVITELHSILDSLVWFHTLRYLRDYHDQFIATNPNGATWFYHSWLDVSDFNQPARWVAYERAASPIWDCAVSAVNAELAREGRADRIRTIPAALALAELINYLTQHGVSQAPGFEGMDAASVLHVFFSDRVHLTDAGHYYIALIVYGSLYGPELQATRAPRAVSSAQAATLKAYAEAFLKARPPGVPPVCATPVPASFVWTFYRYREESYQRAEMGFFRARMKRLKDTAMMLRVFGRQGHDNPFVRDLGPR